MTFGEYKVYTNLKVKKGNKKIDKLTKLIEHSPPSIKSTPNSTFPCSSYPIAIYCTHLYTNLVSKASQMWQFDREIIFSLTFFFGFNCKAIVKWWL